MAHHLFLSYAHADIDRVHPLLAELQHAGLNVWIDETGIHAGDEWEKSIIYAIDQSYGVIFVLTEAFLKSDYIQKEIQWVLEKFDHLPQERRAIFIIRFDNVKSPDPLKHIQYLDGVGKIPQAIVAELLPELPQPSASQQHFVMPFPRLTTFRGRAELLHDLYEKLETGKGRVGIRTAGVTGMGGIGKTQLAVEYAYRYRYFYPAGIYWVNGATSWMQEISKIAQQLRLSPAENSPESRDALLVAAFYNYLRDQNTPALIVLDNVEDPTQILYTDVGPKLRLLDFPAHVLITTRAQDLPDQFQHVDVERLPLVEAREMVRSARDSIDPITLDQLCEAVDRLPLALAGIAEALRLRPTLAAEKFLDYIRKHSLPEALGKAKIDYVDKLNAVLAWHWEQFAPDSNARTLLLLIAAYAENAQVPIVRLSLLKGLTDDPDGWTTDLSDTLHELKSLAERLEGDALRLHPLIREYIRHQQDTATYLATYADNLLTAYRTPQIIYDTMQARSFVPVLADLRETLQVIDHQGLKTLRWYLELEAPALRANPSCVIQQLRERAHHQEDNALADKCSKWLNKFTPLYFKTLEPWRLPTDPALVRIFIGHMMGVERVVMVGDNIHALSASQDKTLRLWNIHTGVTVRVLAGHTEGVRDVVMVGDEIHALSASDDKTLRLWNIHTGVTVRVLAGHTERILSVVMVGDEIHAVSASDDKTLRLWNIHTGVTVRVLAGHTEGVRDVVMVGDNIHALSASQDKTLRLWNIHTGVTVQILAGHMYGVQSVVMVGDNIHALSASQDEMLRLWNIHTGATIEVLRGHTKGVQDVTIAGDNIHALSASQDKTLRLWNIHARQRERIFAGHTHGVQSVVMVGDGIHALSASQDKTLRLWNIQTDSTGYMRSYEREIYSRVQSVVMVGDGIHVLYAPQNKYLRMWNIQTGTKETLMGHTNIVRSVVMVGDNIHALSASDDTTLRLWNIHTKATVRVLKGHTNWVWSVVMVGDNIYALSASADHTLRLWNIHTGTTVRVLTGHTSSVNSVVMVGDNTHALSASADHTLRLWNIHTGTTVRVLTGHTGGLQSVTMVGDNTHALSASRDTSLRLWDIHTGATVRVLTGHTGGLQSVTMVGDNTHALSASADHTLRLWDWKTGECKAILQMDDMPTALAMVDLNKVMVGFTSGRISMLEIYGI